METSKKFFHDQRKMQDGTQNYADPITRGEALSLLEGGFNVVVTVGNSNYITNPLKPSWFFEITRDID